MNKNESSPNAFQGNRAIFSVEKFNEWTAINDTIMGGSSQAACSVSEEGLVLKGNLVEEGGGFVSCRSPEFIPSINLSKFRGLSLEVDGEGRTLKLALACKELPLGFNNLIAGNMNNCRKSII